MEKKLEDYVVKYIEKIDCLTCCTRFNDIVNSVLDYAKNHNFRVNQQEVKSTCYSLIKQKINNSIKFFENLEFQMEEKYLHALQIENNEIEQKSIEEIEHKIYLRTKRAVEYNYYHILNYLKEDVFGQISRSYNGEIIGNIDVEKIKSRINEIENNKTDYVLKIVRLYFYYDIYLNEKDKLRADEMFKNVVIMFDQIIDDISGHYLYYTLFKGASEYGELLKQLFENFDKQYSEQMKNSSNKDFYYT